jgi:hypothetical protein
MLMQLTLLRPKERTNTCVSTNLTDPILMSTLKFYFHFFRQALLSQILVLYNLGKN